MKKIYLVRHSKAVSRHKKIPDMDRGLTMSGIRKSQRIANRLKEMNNLHLNLMLSSPAKRAFQTAEIFAGILNIDKPIQIEESIYSQNHEDILSTLKSLDNSYSSIMVFGHNPALKNLAKSLSSEFNRALPKSGVICIHFKKDNWNHISELSGKLEFFLFPARNKKKDLNDRLTNKIQSTLLEQIINAYDNLDLETMEKIKSPIKKHSQKLGKELSKILYKKK